MLLNAIEGISYLEENDEIFADRLKQIHQEHIKSHEKDQISNEDSKTFLGSLIQSRKMTVEFSQSYSSKLSGSIAKNRQNMFSSNNVGISNNRSSAIEINRPNHFSEVTSAEKAFNQMYNNF